MVRIGGGTFDGVVVGGGQSALAVVAHPAGQPEWEIGWRYRCVVAFGKRGSVVRLGGVAAGVGSDDLADVGQFGPPSVEQVRCVVRRGMRDLEGRHLWRGVPQVQRRPRVGAEGDDRLQLRAGDLVEQVVAPGWYPRCGLSYRESRSCSPHAASKSTT